MPSEAAKMAVSECSAIWAACHCRCSMALAWRFWLSRNASTRDARAWAAGVLPLRPWRSAATAPGFCCVERREKELNRSRTIQAEDKCTHLAHQIGLHTASASV